MFGETSGNICRKVWGKVMIDINETVQRLLIHEALRLQPYYCKRGKLTIGVGRNLDDNPLTAEEERVVGDWRHGITKAAAFYLLRNDILKTEKLLKRRVLFWSCLDDERQYALLDMAFQMGVDGLCSFKKMLSALAIGNYQEAAKECKNSKYACQTPIRADRIAKTIETGRFMV